MKGVDIVVHGSIGHVGGVHGPEGRAGRLRRRRRRPRRLDLRGPRLRARRGREPRRRLRREGDARRAPDASSASCSSGPRPTPIRPSSGATARLGSSTTSRSTTRATTDDDRGSMTIDALQGGGFDPELEDAGGPGLRESALFDRNAIHEIHRMAREGIYDIRGFGAKRRVPHFDDLLFLGASVSRYPLEGYRERCATDVTLGTRFAKKPIHLEIPITIAGMSFGALSAPAKEALGRGASAIGDQHHHRRRRHAARGARALRQARLPDPPLALRDEPRRPAPGRRGRGRGRPGRQAGRRRHAAGPEDLRPGRRDARPAEGRSTSAAPAATPIGRAPTTSRSRSTSCARSPTGASRST